MTSEKIESSHEELDKTLSDEGIDTLTFLENITKEHQRLKQTLIDIEDSTKREI